MKNSPVSKNVFALISFAVLLSSCGGGKYAATNKIYKSQARAYAKIIEATPPLNQGSETIPANQQAWVGSVNFGLRKPNFVILHHTAQKSTEQTINTFILARTQVSAHYIIGRDGKVIQMVNDYLRSHHAGAGKWGNDTDLNSSSIGIELDNTGSEPYPDAQINSLLEVLAALKKKHNIPVANFIGHSDMAPGRKQDPNMFPWKTLAEKGFGYWYDAILITPSDTFDTKAALRIIGYDVSNLPAAITAFKRHFIQTDISPALTPYDKQVLFSLYRKYL
ncbi:N-acetylmuramoyl-L-alanine amidase [Pedobacter faecalis]|uniref:N-acetylmuramoyl-L-alanine amidase n=1 Tax=Pedobacter faecalis TaxID=3041495 RepID=UPI00254EF748|nr:N-acetylmuramoyl-L-alanine amidase [Pedobacter sp. ELA7]